MFCVLALLYSLEEKLGGLLRIESIEREESVRDCDREKRATKRDIEYASIE